LSEGSLRNRYRNPRLVAPYWSEFLRLLESKNNRLIWGGMIALSTIADLTARELAPHHKNIENAIEHGSVITRDNGVGTLALIAAHDSRHCFEIWDFLLSNLASCRAKDLAQHSEKILCAVTPASRTEFVAVLQRRMSELTPAQATRVRRTIRAAGAA
jgi:hypothetical protein